jgi:hypothetical protein
MDFTQDPRPTCMSPATPLNPPSPPSHHNTSAPSSFPRARASSYMACPTSICHVLAGARIRAGRERRDVRGKAKSRQILALSEIGLVRSSPQSSRDTSFGLSRSMVRIPGASSDDIWEKDSATVAVSSDLVCHVEQREWHVLGTRLRL